MTKVWFITGTSSGFGREWTIAALERGDSVAATARDLTTLRDIAAQYGDRLLPLQLDVTDRARAFACVQQAGAHFGRLDVVINNAGYTQFGMVEELSEQGARNQFETNVLGTLWVTQAALPLLREQGGGHIIQVSSVGGVIALPNTGIYNASKWALEGLSQALAQEVAEFGIKVTLVEPTGFATGRSSLNAAPLAAYDELRERTRRWRSSNTKPKEPRATAAAIMRLVDAAEPPLRLFLGAGPLGRATDEYKSRLATWQEWQEVAASAEDAG